MERPLLIAGIDPGTTTAYALLDQNGKVVEKRASKNLEINSLIREITGIGIVLAVGTDKKNAPFMVEKFAIKVGARLIAPENDLLVREKSQMIHGMDARNRHEEDALASALLAFREVNPLLRKIRFHLKKIGKEDMLGKVSKIVFEHRIPIRQAVEIAEQKEPEITEIPLEAEETAAPIEKEAYQRILKENALIRQQNRRLKQEIIKLAKINRIQRERNINVEKRVSERIEHKQKNARTLYDRIERQLREIERLSGELGETRKVIYGMKGKAVLKKLENLTMHEVEKKTRQLDIMEGDIILVENPNIYSENALKMLDGVHAIVYRKPVLRKTREILHFALVDSGRVNLHEFADFAIADWKEIENARESSDVIGRIVQNYREERMAGLR